MPANRRKPALFLVFLLPLLLAGPGCSESVEMTPTAPSIPDGRGDALQVVTQISPATLVVDSTGTWVTVHAEISLSQVDAESVTLEGVVPDLVKADSRGELVAKFARENIVAIVSPPEATLTLAGLTAGGETFVGTDTITVQ